MKFSKESSSENQSPVTLLAALVLVALVPAVGVLWFMSVAMRNERLAVQERLSAVYANHLVSLQQHAAAFVRERQAALQAHAGGAPAETFAAIVRANLADAVIVTDTAGKVLYPSSSVSAAGAEVRVDESADWARARELEFQKNDWTGAAEIYGRIAESTRAADPRARAMHAQAVCWLKAGDKERALGRLTELAGDASLRHATSVEGVLLGPHAQLLILKTLGSPGSAVLPPAQSGTGFQPVNPQTLRLPVRQAQGPEPVEGEAAATPRYSQTFNDLVARLNDYSAAELPANQRRFLMAEVQALAPRLARGPESFDKLRTSHFSLAKDREPVERLVERAPTPNLFPTLAAEQLAADYLEHDPVPPADKPALPLRLVAASASERAADHSPLRQARGPEPVEGLALAATGIPKVWRLPGADRTVVALWREERLRAELAKHLDALALPDVRVSVLAPGETAATIKMPVPPQDAGEFLPGWRLALGFRNGDPLAEASARQARFYLGMGVGVVAIIGVLAVLVARYVSAQMRLARLKDDLVSTVSHELKTPVASIRVLLDTLTAGRDRDEAHRQRYLHLATKENLRLSHLLENFLVFSRLERGQQQFRFTVLSPPEIVRTALDALGERLTEPSCHLTTQLAPELPAIRGDADALSTVLVNLLDNACKYTNGDKRIGVKVYVTTGAESLLQSTELSGRKEAQNDTRNRGFVFAHPCAFLRQLVSSQSRERGQPGEVVVFEVADNGIGIAPEEQRRIFDRFYQVDQSLTRQRGGCGLGLGIVRSIVRAHGGEVEVKSELGRGSTFRVKLPIANTQRESVAEAVAKSNPLDHGLHG